MERLAFCKLCLETNLSTLGDYKHRSGGSEAFPAVRERVFQLDATVLGLQGKHKELRADSGSCLLQGALEYQGKVKLWG